MNIDVFISHHTNSSRHIVEAISNKLESVGIRCWHSSRDIVGGDYATSIMQALTSCKIFLLVLNRPASESAHVLNELEIATGRLSRKEDIAIVPFHVADEEIALAAQYYLRRHHWIDAMTPPMYQRVEDLAKHVAMLLGREAAENTQSAPQNIQPSYRLISNIPQVREVFDGRDELICQIHQMFSGGNRVLFLEGIGGIGKSELAKQYALRYLSEYDTVLFVTFSSDLEQLLCDPTAINIEGLNRKPDEQDAQFFLRKLQVLNTLTSERTLLIVDNFDVTDDPNLKAFLQGNHRIIFTTRNAHSGYATIKIGAIDNTDALMRIFEQNYGCDISEEERPVLEEIFRLVECHTYTIELIAKQMEASFLSAQEMLSLLREGQLSSGVSETVAGREDQRTAFEHICSLFNTSNLTVEEKQLLMYLSFMGTKGLPASRFKEWAQLPNFEIVNQLIHKSWIRRESEQRLSLHPMVREVVHHELTPTAENCHNYLYNMGHFCYHAWFRTYKENLAVADSVLSTLEYFRHLRGQDFHIFLYLCVYLWQVGRFDASISHCHRVYEACVRDFGLNSMETGLVAQLLGGCYFNSRRIRESIPWYKQGLDSMVKSGSEESEDLGMSYEKVARCYTWEYEQDFSKAEELFLISLGIRERLRDRMVRGENATRIIQYEPYDINMTYDRISEVYLEMGRMYQAMGKYDKGYEYALRQLELLQTYRANNISSIAYSYYDCGVCQYHMGVNLQSNGDKGKGDQHLAQAVENLEKALAINMKMRGALAVDTIDNQEYLADAYAAQQRYGEASNCYMAVLTMVENLLGKNHPRLQTVKDKMNFQY